MVPSTWLALLLFLFVVSPGILFELLAAQRHVSAAESAFREIGRVVLGSLGFTSVAIAVLLVVRAVAPAAMPDPQALISGGAKYFASHYALVFIAIVAEALLAHGEAYLLHRFLSRRSGASIRQRSAWSRVFRDTVPKNHAVHARIRMTDGAVIIGQVLHFTADLPVADREIVLISPMAARSSTSKLTPLPDEYKFTVVRGSAIDTISIEHRPLRPDPAELGH